MFWIMNLLLGIMSVRFFKKTLLFKALSHMANDSLPVNPQFAVLLHLCQEFLFACVTKELITAGAIYAMLLEGKQIPANLAIQVTSGGCHCVSNACRFLFEAPIAIIT